MVAVAVAAVQALPLDAAILSHSEKSGKVSLTINEAVHRYHPRKGKKLVFSSLNENEFSAQEEMKQLMDGLLAGRKHNCEVDLRTGGGIVHGVKYCVSSLVRLSAR